MYDVRADNKKCIWIATYLRDYSNIIRRIKSLAFILLINISHHEAYALTNAGDIWLSANDGKIYKYNARE